MSSKKQRRQFAKQQLKRRTILENRHARKIYKTLNDYKTHIVEEINNLATDNLNENLAVINLIESNASVVFTPRLQANIESLWLDAGEFAQQTYKRCEKLINSAKKKANEELYNEPYYYDLRQYAQTISATEVVAIAETTRSKVRKAIEKAIDEGLGAKDLADLISDSTGFNKARAKLIARTEMVSAANTANEFGAKGFSDTFNMPMLKFWDTSGLPNMRPSHISAEAEGGISLNAIFVSTGMRFPGDPMGEVGERANCRCTAIYEPVLN